MEWTRLEERALSERSKYVTKTRLSQALAEIPRKTTEISLSGKEAGIAVSETLRKPVFRSL